MACNACCIGYDPVFESNPSFEYIGSTTIKISWEKVQRNLHCADMFQVVYWETDRKEGTKMTETLIGNYVRSYNIHVKEGVAYSFAVNAIERPIDKQKLDEAIKPFEEGVMALFQTSQLPANTNICDTSFNREHSGIADLYAVSKYV